MRVVCLLDALADGPRFEPVLMLLDAEPQCSCSRRVHAVSQCSPRLSFPIVLPRRQSLDSGRSKGGDGAPTAAVVTWYANRRRTREVRRAGGTSFPGVPESPVADPPTGGCEGFDVPTMVRWSGGRLSACPATQT